MTQLELQAFLAVTRTGSFSQAAQSLFISQPALSRRIRTLEEELGFRLLERQKGARSVEPTQEGRAFTPVAEHWLALWEEARSIPQREENQVFRVASVGSVSTYILAPVLQRFLLDGTSSLTFHQYHSLESYGYVERGEVDLAFISDDMFRRQVETIPAFREPMRLVTRPGSPLPQHVHPSQLDSAREIRMQWNPEYGRAQLHTLQEGPPDRIIYYLLGPRRKNTQTHRLLKLLQNRLEELEGVTSLL